MGLKPRFDNDAAIYQVLKYYGPLTRGELHHYTHIPRTTIFDALKRLQLKDKVWRDSKKRKGRGNGVYLPGRPNIIWGVIDEE